MKGNKKTDFSDSNIKSPKADGINNLETKQVDINDIDLQKYSDGNLNQYDFFQSHTSGNI